MLNNSKWINQSACIVDEFEDEEVNSWPWKNAFTSLQLITPFIDRYGKWQLRISVSLFSSCLISPVANVYYSWHIESWRSTECEQADVGHRIATSYSLGRRASRVLLPSATRSPTSQPTSSARLKTDMTNEHRNYILMFVNNI